MTESDSLVALSCDWSAETREMSLSLEGEQISIMESEVDFLAELLAEMLCGSACGVWES